MCCFLVLFAFALNKVLIYYAVISTAYKGSSVCGITREGIVDLKMRKAPGWELERFMHDKFSCLKKSQNFIENYYYPIPDKWINPPPGSVSYKDLDRIQTDEP